METSPQEVINNVKYNNPILQEQCIIFASLGSHYLKQLIKHNNLNYKVEVKRYVLDDSISDNSDVSQYHYYIEINTNTKIGNVIIDNVWYLRKYEYLRKYCPKGIKKISDQLLDNFLFFKDSIMSPRIFPRTGNDELLFYLSPLHPGCCHRCCCFNHQLFRTVHSEQ